MVRGDAPRYRDDVPQAGSVRLRHGGEGIVNGTHAVILVLAGASDGGNPLPAQASLWARIARGVLPAGMASFPHTRIGEP